MPDVGAASVPDVRTAPMPDVRTDPVPDVGTAALGCPVERSSTAFSAPKPAPC
jgi:hypothetical protein